MRAGYLHPAYPASLSEFGVPIALRNSAGWLLQRPIPETSLSDAMGCYPLFVCQDWSAIGGDLAELASDLVSVVVVADPLGDHSAALLASQFDRVTPFKDHFVIDTSKQWRATVRRSHREHARRALRLVNVDSPANPTMHAAEWSRLYDVLADRHRITGIRRFSPASLAEQLAVPGLTMFRAIADGETVGIELWYQANQTAVSHLTALSPTGYRLRASYALKWQAIDHFSTRVAWINLGAAVTTSVNDGLLQFKGGWATGTKTAFLCGRVLQPAIYDELTQRRDALSSTYFPSYRSGESI